MAAAKDLGIETLRGADLTSDRQTVVELELDSRTVLSAEKSPECLSFQNQLDTAPPHELKNTFQLLHEILVSL